MSRNSVVTVTWTCDACGAEAPEVDGYSPRGWHQVALALASAQLLMTTDPVDWNSPRWGVPGHNVHYGTTDDLGDHGRHSDETEEA